MNWWSIIKGKWVGRKLLKQIRVCFDDIEGLNLDDFVLSKAGHLVAKCTYTGVDLPPGKTEVKINCTINVKRYKKTGGGDKRLCGDIRARVRKELAKRKVFIGDW